MSELRTVVVQPALEPNPWFMRAGKRWAFFGYIRWSSWGIGIDVLGAGIAMFIGPLMFGVCHVERQLEAFDKLRSELESIK